VGLLRRLKAVNLFLLEKEAGATSMKSIFVSMFRRSLNKSRNIVFERQKGAGVVLCA
jgi:hypothetical protein